jgi:cholesterol oxidase
LPVNALPLPPALRRRLGRSTALLGMGKESASAELALVGAELRWTASRDQDPVLYRDMERASAAVADGYRPKRSFVGWPRGPGSGPLVTVHPLGGAAVGSSPDDAVIDHTGQVFGHPGLYIADGSFYPSAPGIPPSMTIAAFSERLSALMT